MRIPRLHLVSRSQIVPVDSLLAIVCAAVAGGVGAIHLREPALSDPELAQLVVNVTDAVADTDAMVLVNGRVEVSAFPGISGVHLPERMIDELADVRRQLPDDAVIGVSVHSPESAVAAERAGADYVIAGHVFETGSKPGQAGRGSGFIRNVAQAVSIPVIAIGGITPDNTRDVISAGAYGIAVLSGILAADDPEQAASAYRAAIDSALERYQ